MATATATYIPTTSAGTISVSAGPTDLGERYAKLKPRVIKPENNDKVKASWVRLLKALERDVERIAEAGPSFVPSVTWSDIETNNYQLPESAAKLLQERGCLIVRGVASEEEALRWKALTDEYTSNHPELGGEPHNVNSNHYIHWSKAQAEARSHPNLLKLMKVMGKQWKQTDKDLLLDMDSQIVYPDRSRVRGPDEGYRDVYREIYEGRWEDWEPFLVDRRPNARQDIYDGKAANGSTCSTFRNMQGWMALSDSKAGEGTIRFLPNLKTAIPYLLLRPFFWKDDGSMDLETGVYPGATPGSGQFFADDSKLFHHLQTDRSVVSIPYVKPGDFVFWHADLCHEVDKVHAGNTDSAVTYIAQVPLCRYTIDTLLNTRECFLSGKKPKDFYYEEEKYHSNESTCEDRGKPQDILCPQGYQSVGLEPFDTNEPGLLPGQKRIRELANEALGFSS